MQQKRVRVMNVTLYNKTIRSKRERVSSLGMEPLMARIRDDARLKETVEALREELPTLLPSSHWHLIEDLPRICPGLDSLKKPNGRFTTSYNGVVLLEVQNLNNANEANDVKRRAAAWPTTLAAFVGASGRSVKIMVRGTLTDGTLPSEVSLINIFHRHLYEMSAKVYATFLGQPLRNKQATPHDMFRLTWDPEAYHAPQAAPITIDSNELAGELLVAEERAQEYARNAIKPGADKRRRYSMQFALAVRQMREAIEGQADSDAEVLSNNEETLSYEEQLAIIAQNCAKLGIPIYETFEQSKRWIRNHIDTEEHGHTIIESAYLSQPRKNPPTRRSMQELTMELQAFLNERYDLRFNELANGVEYRPNHSSSFDFTPLDTRIMNTMIQEAMENGIEVYDRDIKRFLGSTRVRSYNAARAYLNEVSMEWDGKTDYIGALADRVPSDNPHWRDWFHTWFLGMVAQWAGFNQMHDNAIVPLLIGPQGCGKSTFGQLILPPKLRRIGYRELVDFSNKQEMERMLTTSLLINLNDFYQISERIQQEFLKGILLRSSFKGRRPYGTALVDLPRVASFIATTSVGDILNNPSSSRRFIAAEINDGQYIDTQSDMPYAALYSQAHQELYRHLHRSYFTLDEIRLIEAHNARFANLRPEVNRFMEVYEPTIIDDGSTQWLSVSEMASEIHRRTRFEYSSKSINYLGRWLTSETKALRLHKKLIHGFAVYSVRRRSTNNA